MPEGPVIGQQLDCRFEPDAHWVICEHEDPDRVTAIMVFDDGSVGAELDIARNRWHLFLERDVA